MTTPLNFLVLTSDKFPPFRVDVTLLFGKELAGRGHTMDWVMQAEAPGDEREDTYWEGGRIFLTSTSAGESRIDRLKKHFAGWINDLRVFSLVRRGTYQFVLVKDKFFAAIMALIACRLKGIPFLYWLSYPFPEASLYAVKAGIARYQWLYWIRGHVFDFLLYYVILPSAHHVFVQSEQMKRDIAARGVSPEKLTPVPMGVSLDDFPGIDAADPVRAAGSPPRVVYTGTLIKSRKLDFLVRVFSELLKDIPEAMLYVVGGTDDPSDIQMLESEARRLGITDQVIFTGRLPRSEALEYVKQADVCVSPFYPTPILNSTSPTKLIEYMAMGKAVVANSHPEQSLVIAESGAGICVDWNEADFAAAIGKILADATLRKEMGLRGRAYVERHRTYGHIAGLVEQRLVGICAETGVNG